MVVSFLCWELTPTFSPTKTQTQATRITYIWREVSVQQKGFLLRDSTPTTQSHFYSSVKGHTNFLLLTTLHSGHTKCSSCSLRLAIARRKARHVNLLQAHRALNPIFIIILCHTTHNATFCTLCMLNLLLKFFLFQSKIPCAFSFILLF